MSDLWKRESVNILRDSLRTAVEPSVGIISVAESDERVYVEFLVGFHVD